MGFRDSKQRAEACRALCALGGCYGLGDLHLAELLRVLRPSDLRALAELLTALAVSPLEVDAWLVSYAPPQIPRLRPL